jgi:hypothetical protein
MIQHGAAGICEAVLRRDGTKAEWDFDLWSQLLSKLPPLR